MIATERWAPVLGYEGLYEVSDFGRVRRVAGRVPWKKGLHLYRARILKGAIRPGGYFAYNLCKDGHGRSHSAHVLVLDAFVGPRPPGTEARHLDGGRTNNHLDNLCWGTRAQNTTDRVGHGTWSSWKNKLNEEQVFRIRARLAAGIRCPVIAREFGVTADNIYVIRDRKTWPHVEVPRW